MTPREFLGRYRYDGRLVTGGYFPSGPLAVSRGDRVAVVLLYSGGPSGRDDIAPYLNRLFMDPALVDLPLGKRLRPLLARLAAAALSKSVGKEYEAIGGRSLINRLADEQARVLETVLTRRFGADAGIAFQVYRAARYGRPSSEEAARQMEADGITHVVLLPLYPQYSKSSTGSSLVYWWTLEQAGEIPSWPTTYVFEYAAHPKYVQALSERIDEALQRFPREVRARVHLVFSAHGTPLREMTERHDPYCCLIHSTVDRVMKYRGHDHPFHVAFQSKLGLVEWLTPGTSEKVQELARAGHDAVLVVPITFVLDCLETAYKLDVKLREEAEHAGVRHYEVSSALNCHPLFIEALAEVAVSQLAGKDGETPAGLGGDGVPPYALCPLSEREAFAVTDREVRCEQCPALIEAGKWTSASRSPDSVRVKPSRGSA